MYQVEVGSVYVHPDYFEDVAFLDDIVIPESFDSVLVNGIHYVVKKT
jgi:hypothetical protein